MQNSRENEVVFYETLCHLCWYLNGDRNYKIDACYFQLCTRNPSYDICNNFSIMHAFRQVLYVDVCHWSNPGVKKLIILYHLTVMQLQLQQQVVKFTMQTISSIVR